MRIHIDSIEARNGTWIIYFDADSSPDRYGNVIGNVIALKMLDMYIGYGHIFSGAQYNTKDNTIHIPIIYPEIPEELLRVLKRLPYEIVSLLDPDLSFEEIEYLVEQGVIDEDDLNSFILILHPARLQRPFRPT